MNDSEALIDKALTDGKRIEISSTDYHWTVSPKEQGGWKYGWSYGGGGDPQDFDMVDQAYLPSQKKELLERLLEEIDGLEVEIEIE